MPNIPGETPQDNPNIIEEDDGAKAQELGAKTLSQVGFNERNIEIVDSSFNKALKKGGKFPANNRELLCSYGVSV